MKGISVVIFDDSNSIREAISLLISSNPKFILTGSYSDATSCIEMLEEETPDVVLMDIDMPEVTGIQAVQRIHSRFPSLPIIMLTVFDHEDKVFESLCAGAVGYLLKNTPPARLLEAIQEVYEGGAPMTPSIARKVMHHFQQNETLPEKEDYHLSPREKEVLAHLVNGLAYKMIAAQMGITYETVRTHSKKIYDKLHVSSMTEAVVKTLNQKLLGL
ncbi:MAG: response regulator transcription factor [Chitinophagaceae bacterium]|nr:response regulator transcription factor [Chitinophagaceae bacterium]